MKRIIFIFLATVLVISGCEQLDPRPIQDLSTDELLSAADYGEGMLTKAYANLNPNYDINSEYYTDNAVPSNTGSNLLALGGWSLETNPIGNWNLWYNSIAYCNQYLELGQDLLYSVSDSTLNDILQRNRRAEAFYLRAWYHWKLLQTYGGYAAGESEALGVPIVTESLTREDNLDLPRNTYEEVVTQIAEDLDSVIAVLPLTYDGSSLTDNITNRGRASGLAAMALKARVYLYAASPAYGPSTPDLWERAADAAYEAIDASGGLSDLDAYGDFNDFSGYDYIWIQPPFTSNYWERTHYPPSLYGNGQANPSQNLVDAFPAADGYPIDESTAYDEDDPYSNRDPRFERFIFHNFTEYNGNFIRTYEGGADAPGGISQRGTRTGYYMQKLLSTNVRLTPGDVTSDIKFYAYLDRTELYLNFAEAANEAYGPTAGPGYIFTAADALAKIRERAGIDSDGSTSGYQDQYLDDAATTGQSAFRDLVHNERRVELSFEGFRFWDVRRLNEDLNHTVRGVTINVAANPPEPAVTNLALDASPTDDYSPYGNPNNLNNGTTGGSAWHNWYSARTWRYVQYDLSEYPNLDGITSTYQIQNMEVYWWSDGGGVLYPDSIYVEAWDLETNQWVEVYSDYSGVTQDYWSADIDPDVNTDRIRLNFRGPESCGIWEWLVWGTTLDKPVFVYEYVDVENHTFQDYMRYVPLPYSQILTMSNLKQNTGW